MKRSILLVCVFALLCAVLCGCGDYRNDNLPMETPGATMDLMPEVSPMVSMNPEDGYVRDGDGVIEDSDTGRPTVTVSPMPTTDIAPSASPNQTAGTSQTASPKP